MSKMTRLKTMYLSGTASTDVIELLDNQLPGIGWMIEDFRIICSNAIDVDQNTYCARLQTKPDISIAEIEWRNNSVLGVATYGGGGATQIIDDATLVTEQLFIQNLTVPGGSKTQPEIDYHITLGQYSISSLRRLASLVKEKQGQDF